MDLMRPLRILLVEDDTSIGDLLAEVITDIGHIVCGIATTEASAVAAALLQMPDLMIVDVGLGQGNGIAAIETISRTVSIPHILMSGNEADLRRASAITLLKPFSQRELAAAVVSSL